MPTCGSTDDWTAELALVAAELELSMPERGTIVRLSQTPDDMGGQSDSWAAAGTANMRISKSFYPPQEGVLAERIAGRASWFLYFPLGTDVGIADRVTSNGRTFELVGTDNPHSYETYLRLWAVETT